jgi:O-antigen/teichoic acid export membrane protein
VRLAPLVRGVVLYTVGNLIPRIGLFLLLPVYVAFMTPSEFGAMSLLVSLASLLAIFYRCGLDTALLRLDVDTPGDGVGSLDLSGTVATVIATIIASLVAALAVGPFFPSLFVGIAFVPYGVLALAITAANTFQFLPTVWLRATEQPGRFVLLTFSAFAATAVSAVILLAMLRTGLLGGLLSQLAAGVVMLLAAGAIVFSVPRARPSLRALQPALRFGVPLLPHQIGAWVLNVSDRWLIGLLIGLPALGAQAAIGVYALGYQIGNAISLLALSVQAAWTPVLYRQGETPEGPALHREMFTATTALFFGLAVAAAVLAPEVIEVIAPPTYAQAVDVMRIVAFAAAFYGLYVMLVGVIMLTRRTGFLPVITVAAAVTNIAANVVLIPRIGILGAAWATFLAFALYAFATYAYARRRFPRSVDLPRVALLIGAAVATTVVGIWLPSAASLPRLGVHLVLIGMYTAMAIATATPAVRKLAAIFGTIARDGEQQAGGSPIRSATR